MRRFDIAQIGKRVIFFAPHDDDAAIGCGLLMSALKRHHVETHVIVMTDGSLGYVRTNTKAKIARIRKIEAAKCYRALGVKETTFWGFPDACLWQYRCWKTASGKIGAYQKLSRDVRRIRPSSVFLPNPADIHPDHQAAFQIWNDWGWQTARPSFPDIGRPLEQIPRVFLYRIRDSLKRTPGGILRHKADPGSVQKKKRALAQFVSQNAILHDIPIQEKREEYAAWV